MTENLDMISERIDKHEVQLRRHELSLYGDSIVGHDGVVVSVRRQQDTIDELKTIVRDMHTRWQTLVVMGRVVIGILGLTGVGVWIGLLEAFK